MDITVLAIDGCPNSGPAEANVRAALARTDQAASVVVRTVSSDAEAVEMAFAGSPTILLDGHDPFPGAVPGGLSCRIFPTPAGPRGFPSVDQLVEAILRPGSGRRGARATEP